MTKIGNRAQTVIQNVRLKQLVAQASDKYDSDAGAYAEQLVRTKKVDNTQVRGLETIAYTTDKVSDVADWLKIRVGRDNRQEGWACGGVGRDFLNALTALRKDAARIASELEGEPDLERQVHLLLIREYVKHLAAHFEYLKVEQELQR
jgi:hypothetical protein